MGDHEKDKKKKKEKHHHHQEEEDVDSPQEEKPKKKKSKGSISLVVSTPEGEDTDAKEDGDGVKEKKKKKEKHHHHHYHDSEEGGEEEESHKKEKKKEKKKKEEKEDEEDLAGEEKEGEKDGEKDKAGLLDKIEKRKKDRERRANTLRFRRSFGKNGGTTMIHKKSRSHVQPREEYSADDMDTAKKRHSSLETVSNGPRPAISLDNGLRVVEENKPDKLSRWASLKGIRDGFLRSQNEEARRNRSFSGSLPLDEDLESIANPLLALQQKQHLMEQKKEREILSESSSLDERTRMRHKVINEIINTERDYINDLTRVIKLFLEPLARDGILTTEEIKDIFSNVKLLVNVNNALLDDLWKQAKETNGEQLGQSFVLLSHYLKMYSQYCGNQKVSREAITAALKNNSRFKAFIEKQATLPELNNLTLKDFLIKPVQRLCKYPLLLRELLKYTDESHPDYEKLKAAFEAIQEAVESVNAQKQTEEEMEEVAEMLNTLTGTEKFGVQLMVPGRKFVKEGTVKTAPKDHSSSTVSHFFMFSDLLILAEEGSVAEGKKKGKKGSNKREVLGMLPFAMCLLNFAPDDEANGLKHVVEIIQSTNIFTFHFDSSTEKEEWIKLLKIENMNDDEDEEKTKD